MSAKFLPLRIIKQTSNNPTGTVLFFHGSGDTGDGVREWVKFLVQDFQFPHLQVLFPTAPLRPYTPLDGGFSNVWFDRLSISPDVPEHTETLDEVCTDMVDFIKNEVIQKGIPENRIIVGGFSMGGALAMHIGFRHMPRIAGIFALSSFLSYTSSIYKLPKPSSELPPLLMCHGNRDDLVPYEWGEQTFKTLTTQFGVKGEFQTIPNALHELKRKEILLLQEWLNKQLPP
ncbi:hypothetical protein L9F63_001923 [Diploptera punctata]|uniref:palmitoyl-protein hydrolase n=1 Tax=Diploptera punctata TaxID=6984 RepID=A0AAD8EIV1_DIPPU|nr:hypothetical protein L9F63_001923 [Diploptera punctata]